MPRIVIFDRDVAHAEALVMALRRHNHSITSCRTHEELLAELDRARFDIVILDISSNRPQDWIILDQLRGKVD